MWSILTLRPYLYGDTFTLRTHHNAVKWILNLADSVGRLTRWRLRSAEYEYDVEYHPRVKHQLADGVFRLRRTEIQNDEMDVDDKVPVFITERSPDGTETSFNLQEDEVIPVGDEGTRKGRQDPVLAFWNSLYDDDEPSSVYEGGT